MKLSEAIGKFGLTVFAPLAEDIYIVNGYTSDLLSDVIANAGAGTVWITMQTHANVIAVAALKDLAAIIVVGGHKPAEDTLELAKSKGVCVLGTQLPAFDITGQLFKTGIRGYLDGV